MNVFEIEFNPEVKKRMEQIFKESQEAPKKEKKLVVDWLDDSVQYV